MSSSLMKEYRAKVIIKRFIVAFARLKVYRAIVVIKRFVITFAGPCFDYADVMLM